MLLALVLLGVGPAAGDRASSTSAGFFLQPRDVVVFLGDSITENGRYFCYLEEYLRSQQPRYDVRFINSGWGGDRVHFGQKEGGSPGALRRVERDVLAHHPTVVVILLGMNDGRSTDAGRLAEFRAGMEEIVRRIRANSKARVVLLTGTPYDTTQRAGEDPALGKNVERFAKAVGEIGRSAGVTVVDLHGPLQRLVRACRERHPPVALIPDGVHPTDVGHLAVASHILQAWRAPVVARRLTLSAPGPVVRREGSEIRAVRVAKGTLSFERRLTALPIAVSPEARDLLRGEPLIERLCNDLLSVTQLPAAHYELRIDGRPCAVLSREQLQRGADLSRLEVVPDSQQARRVSQIAQQSGRLHHDAWRAEQRRVAIPVAPPKLSLRQRVGNWMRGLGGTSSAAATSAPPPAPALPSDWKQRLQGLERQWRAEAVPRWHRFVLTPVGG